MTTTTKNFDVAAARALADHAAEGYRKFLGIEEGSPPIATMLRAACDEIDRLAKEGESLLARCIHAQREGSKAEFEINALVRKLAVARAALTALKAEEPKS